MIHPNIEKIWNAFDEQEKNYFLTRFSKRFNTLMSPMPIATAQVLSQSIDNGQLRIMSSIQLVTEYQNGHRIFFNSGVLNGDRIINATEPTITAYGSLNSNTSLIAMLQQRNGTELDRFGGIPVKSQDSSLVADHHIRFLGQATRGTHYITNSLQALRRQANTVINTL